MHNTAKMQVTNLKIPKKKKTLKLRNTSSLWGLCDDSV